MLPSESLGEYGWGIDTVLQGNDGGVFLEQRPEGGRKRFDGPHLRCDDDDVTGSDGTRIELGKYVTPQTFVERFARAVCDEGVDVESILVITYTERTAGELRGRIRARLLELGRHDLARSLDGAWISTIHGLCARILRAHALSAGIDPDFRVLVGSPHQVALAAHGRFADLVRESAGARASML